LIDDLQQNKPVEGSSIGDFKKHPKSPVYRWVSRAPKEIPFISLMIATIAGFFSVVLLLVPSDIYADLVVEILDKIHSINPNRAVTLFVLLIGFVYLLTRIAADMSKRSRLTDRGFIDIDYEKSKNKELYDEMEKLKLFVSNKMVVDKALRERYAASFTQDTDEPTKPSVNPVESHILGVIKSLEQHIDLSDKKASRLLDTGTMYLRRGIYFYVSSIFVWQLVAHIWGVDRSLIFGVVSCSLTFLVVEFLAAWFLKQYRNFNDSSMQFMRVKSTFDRYLLSYHTIAQFSGDQESAKAEARALMLKVLEESVRWPELNALKSTDVNHMVQMFESVGSVLDRVKDLAMKKEKQE
ncbi:hypothetical protein, partial [Pseudomonas syringae]